MVLIRLKDKANAGYIDEDAVTSSDELFEDLAAHWKAHELKTKERIDNDIEILSNERQARDIWMTSYEDIDEVPADTDVVPPSIIANTHGFAGAMIYAYQNDLSIVLRPDDVWLAILSQFSCYISKHAEELRPKIAGFDGEKPMEVDLRHDLTNKSLRGLAAKIINTLGKDVLSSNFAASLMPKFSTTTETDRWVASIAILGSVMSYLEDVPDGNCGLTSVRLEGRKNDWVAICERVKVLRDGNYGDEFKEWTGLLLIVCQSFQATVERRGTVEVRAFWNMMCDIGGGRKGKGAKSTLGGWITTFCFWDADGNRIESFSSEEVQAMCKRDGVARTEVASGGIQFPVISTKNSIPSGVTEVKVLVAQEHEQLQYDVTVIAGLMGLQCMKQAAGRTGLDTIQLVPGYWLVEDDCRPLWKPVKALYD